MKQIKVLGPGCKRCMQTVDLIEAKAREVGVEVTVEKVADYAEIARFGVISTPGIMIDGKVVHAGGLPRSEDIGKWLMS
ncbi:MAG: thioredoxin family protein [Rhodospirillaceae bacterium]